MSRMSVHVLLLLVLVAAATLGASPPAHADAAQARIHFEKGRTYFQVDEYRKAIDEFKAAHIDRPDPAFLYNIAECYRHLGEPRDALTYYRRFLKAAPASDRSRPAVEKRIAELQAHQRAGARAGGPSATADEVVSPASAEPPAAAIALTTAPAPALPAATLVDPATSTSPGADRGAARPFYRRTGFLVAVGAALVAGAIAAWALSRDPTSVPGTALGNQETHWQ